MTRRDFIVNSGLITLGLSQFLNGKLKATDFKNFKIGYLPITDHLLITAKELENANITPIKFPSWSDLSAALRTRSINGAFILTPLALKLKSQGLNIKALFAAHRNGSALIVKNTLESNDITALKGLKIAIPSRFSTHYLLLSTLLEKANLTPKDVRLIDMAPPEMRAALNNKSIDAFIVAEPFCYAAESRKNGKVFALSKDILNEHICCVFVTHGENLTKYTNEIKNLVDSFKKTANFIESNHEKTAQIAPKFIGQQETLIKNLLNIDSRVSYKNLTILPNDINLTIEQMKKFGLDSLNISFNDFVDSSFIEG